MRPCQYCQHPVANDVVLCQACVAKGVAERPLPSASELPSQDSEPVVRPHWIVGIFGQLLFEVIFKLGLVGLTVLLIYLFGGSLTFLGLVILGFFLLFLVLGAI